MIFAVEGQLLFDTLDLTKKHKAQSSWKKTAIIVTGCDIENYYSWFIKRRFNLTLNKTIRGTHVTFISDKINNESFNRVAEKYRHQKAIFYYENVLRTNGKHWWLRSWFPEGEKIREEMGLCKTPHFPFHLTLGIVNDKNINHSEYILRVSKKFEILPNDVRINYTEEQLKNLAYKK